MRPAGYIGLRAMAMIGIADRQLANLRTPLPEGTTLTTVDPVVDVVGLFEVQPGLLRINKDYGWLRAADVMAEGDPDLLADVAAGTHALTEARCEAWRLEETFWRAGKDSRAAGTLSLVREAESACGTSSSSASSSASRCPTAARRGGATTRCTPASARRRCRRHLVRPGPASTEPRTRPLGQPTRTTLDL